VNVSAEQKDQLGYVWQVYGWIRWKWGYFFTFDERGFDFVGGHGGFEGSEVGGE
jgi:hypothetical protein